MSCPPHKMPSPEPASARFSTIGGTPPEWLICLVRMLEQDQLGLANGQFHNRPAPHIFGHQVGKRQAEHLLYWTTIAAWLLLPVIAAATQ